MYCFIFMLQLNRRLPIDIPVCSKYGAIKSTTSSRSDVIVNAATAISSSYVR